MTDPISLSGDDLMRQAKMTAHDFLLAAVHDVDEIFGLGISREHPELVAAYVQAAAMDFGAASIARHIRAGLDAIAGQIASLETRKR